MNKRRNLALENKLMSNLDDESFWRVIEYSKEITQNKQAQVKLLVQILSEKNLTEIAEFDSFVTYYRNKSYTSDLWAIAFYLNNGCSDDSFEYYRGWLISEGKEKFTILTGNPNLISDHFSIEEINGFSEDFITLGYLAIDKSDPDNYDKHEELEDLSDKIYKEKFNYRPTLIDFNWKTKEDIDKLFPSFISSLNK